MKIRFEDIQIDSGTQQRPIDESVVQRYVALMKDGVKFPPIELVSDRNSYWLWDGFHRYQCAKSLNQKSIEANIRRGNLRDAIWLSFSANKAHGFPRQRGIAKSIIEQILTDKSWSKKSLSAIARHVGVSEQYVSLIKNEFNAHGTSTCTIEPDSEPENADFEVTTDDSEQIVRDDEIEVERGGTTYTQKSQEKQHIPDEPLIDLAGREIPENLRDIWRGRSVIQKLLNDLSRIKTEVTENLDNCNPVFSLLNASHFQVEYGNFRRFLKFAMPYAVCVYCGGDAKDCKACKGFGFLNEMSYDNAPGELKV